jgi:poly(A) polymerase
VLKRLRDAGHVAYFAGGCVRDELMGLVPKDYDVATDAPPRRVQELFSRTQAVGAAFGVILVRHRKSVVEVATFRTDISYEDGRRPTAVRFTTAEEDAKRRDFTINGVFLDPIENRVIDYVGGQQDVRDKLLRAIGNPDERFAEDHLRLLRAVRFASRFDLTIEPDTARAITRHAPQLVRISPERIAEELRLMLGPATRPRAWRALWEFTLVHQLMRFLPPPHPSSFDPARSIVGHLARDRSMSFGTVLAAAVLCYRWQAASPDSDLLKVIDMSLGIAASKAMRQALRISNEELDELSGVLRSLNALLGESTVTVARQKRFLAEPSAGATLELFDAIEAIPGYDWRIITSLRLSLTSLRHTEFAPLPLLNGDDLIARGLQPGRAFKRALDFVYDEQLEGRVGTREQALELGEMKVREFEAEKPAR